MLDLKRGDSENDDMAAGDMVIVRRTGLTGSGRIGLLIKRGDRNEVQFGASGPVMYYTRRSLRRATRAEIKAAGLSGVGANEPKA